MLTTIHFANILTISRVLILVPYVLLFYIPYDWANWTAVTLYLYACLTDYFDGFFARKHNQESSFGRFLDPVADKLLIITTFVMLAGTDRLSGLSLIPAVVILCREVFVSGLREFLAEVQVSVPVTVLAKWKTAIQMGALSFLLADDMRNLIWGLHSLGIILLWTAAILTLVTGYQYMKACYPHIRFAGN
jgi:cardiolipin synthase